VGASVYFLDSLVTSETSSWGEKCNKSHKDSAFLEKLPIFVFQRSIK
jgi:hypothetical protein